MPERLASASPIAIACFLLFTFPPLPLFNLPFLNACISLSTFLPADGEYLRDEDFFLDEFFFAADFLPAEEDFLAEDFLVEEDLLREELLEDFFADEDFFLRVDFVAIPHS